ncbi:hypothetical protein GCM10010387_31360 [Streptomyces inusitatus]|uniref:Endonuclease/exonuclease/phosphatase domain-containing protein n=2 Tax=Streptomyces inusitatus TaxID=68221 RepID=A0A918Q6K9_9ACTN|nr:hypothetical protein GCM10010387_31360 [Streptomyces inusitatus]
MRGALAVCAALLGLLAPTTAGAAAFPKPSELSKTAGQKFHIKVAQTGKYVTLSNTDQGILTGALRVQAGTPATGDAGLPHVFTLHTSRQTENDLYGETVTLRSAQNGLYAAAEMDYLERWGVIRAQSEGPIGEEARFTLEKPDSEKDEYALKSNTTGKYLSARDNATDKGLLIANQESARGWERFVLEPVPGPGALAQAPAAAPKSLDVMSWNACLNNGTKDVGTGALRCPLYKSTAVNFATEFMAQLKEHEEKVLGTPKPGDPRPEDLRPDIILLQEFCEKYARPLEDALEANRSEWDVRFAPIEYKVRASGKDAPLKAQKPCARDVNGVDRGAYGVAIAVPDENKFYEAHSLTSPADEMVTNLDGSVKVNPDGTTTVTKKKEQRTALCATVPSWSVYACTAHFSHGGEADAATRLAQSEELRAASAKATAKGYRVIVGGDLNAAPGDPVAKSFYDAGHQECDAKDRPATPTEPATKKDRPTTTGNNVKYDYVFAPANSSWTFCRVASAPPVDKPHRSDHYVVRGDVSLG